MEAKVCIEYIKMQRNANEYALNNGIAHQKLTDKGQWTHCGACVLSRSRNAQWVACIEMLELVAGVLRTHEMWIDEEKSHIKWYVCVWKKASKRDSIKQYAAIKQTLGRFCCISTICLLISHATNFFLFSSFSLYFILHENWNGG